MTDELRGDEEARAERLVRIGRPPRNRGEVIRKLVWIVPWLVFLSSPVRDLAVSFVLFAGGAAWLYRKDTLKA